MDVQDSQVDDQLPCGHVEVGPTPEDAKDDVEPKDANPSQDVNPVDDPRPATTESTGTSKPDEQPKRRRRGKQTELIQCPPMLEPEVLRLAESKLPGSLDSDVGGQRDLKRKLDEEARAQAEKKKEDAMAKKEAANALAIAKAKAKLEKALAKAEAMKERKRPVRRKLAPQFQDAAAADPRLKDQVVSPEKEQQGRKGKPAAGVTLSPKAKRFAKACMTPNTKMAKNKQLSEHRGEIARMGMSQLRKLALPDLMLPPDSFDKKILACNHMYV